MAEGVEKVGSERRIRCPFLKRSGHFSIPPQFAEAVLGYWTGWMRLFSIYQAIMGCGGSPAPARPRASWLPGAEAGRGGKLETLERQAVRASECLGKPWERLPPNSLG